jgi:MFS family permease
MHRARTVPVVSAYPKARLFLVSSLALTMAGVGAALRANTASDLQRIFLDPIDKAHSGEMIATVLGLPFLGFALTIAIGSPLLDYVGMGLLLPLSGVCFTVGALIMIVAGSLATGAGVYTVVWIGALITGIGWGLVETVVNLVPDGIARPGRAERRELAGHPSSLTIAEVELVVHAPSNTGRALPMLNRPASASLVEKISRT